MSQEETIPLADDEVARPRPKKNEPSTGGGSSKRISFANNVDDDESEGGGSRRASVVEPNSRRGSTIQPEEDLFNLDRSRRQSTFSESESSISGKRKPRFSQLFNFEQDFKVVLEKEEEKKALEMFSQKPTRIALQRVYEKGKPQDILGERRNRIPTPEELRGYIPNIRDFILYLIQLVLLVCATIAYSGIDIYLYNHVFVAKDSDGNPIFKNGVTLYATTVNLIGVCFDFLWKFMICSKVYPNALQKWWSRAIWASVGCIVHVLTILAIRYPLFAAEAANGCPNGYIFLTGSLVYLITTYVLDFVVMPLLFRRLDPIGKDIIRSKVVAGELKPPRVYIGAVTLLWVFSWLLLTYLAIFLRPMRIGVAMEVVLWVFVIVTFIIGMLDNGKGLIHNVQYLIFTLWYIYLIPQMTGSIITTFVFLENTGARFVMSLVFIALAQLFISTINNASSFMGSGGATAHYVFAVQLFEYFFGALFFVNVTIDALFWLLLFAQSFWLIFRNSGLGKDIFVWSYVKVIQPKLLEWKFGVLHNLTFESSRTRLYHQARMAVQYTICDFTVLIGIPLQYHLSTRYLTDLGELQEYAWFFQMTLCEHDQGTLYKRFLIVAGIKLLFHILAHTMLWYKVRSYNKQSVEYGLPTISFIGLFSDYLRKYWVYFIIVIIWGMKASYIAFSVILSASQSTALKAAGDPSFANMTDRDIFWVQDLLVFVGYRFVTADTLCGAITNATVGA